MVQSAISVTISRDLEIGKDREAELVRMLKADYRVKLTIGAKKLLSNLLLLAIEIILCPGASLACFHALVDAEGFAVSEDWGRLGKVQTVAVADGEILKIIVRIYQMMGCLLFERNLKDFTLQVLSDPLKPDLV